MQDTVLEDKLKEKVELSILFDFYGELLKDHNKQIFADYILNDLSLGEIAEEQGISRQGVYDIVKRCSKQLKDCEQKLCLIEKFKLTKSKINRIKELTEQLKILHQQNNIEDNNQNKIIDKNPFGSIENTPHGSIDNPQSEKNKRLTYSEGLADLLEIIELTDDILQDL